MTESAFAITSKILNERSDASDLVRIIAKDGHLNKEERATLNQCADDFEATQKSLVNVYALLVETQQRLIALNERMLEADKMVAKTFPGLQMTISGPLVRLGAQHG